ncbi:MAG: LytS/YhcK type 5TM receptor domain-containing protein [Roseburia sp.]
MEDTMFFNLLLNIGLLVLIANTLTTLPVVRNMLTEGKHTVKSCIALSVLFGLISICSTYTGVRTQGAIVNTRVIGVLAAGLLGGPYVGMGAALIGGLHRYLFDIGGFTAVSCAVSTILEGVIGAVFSKSFQEGKLGSVGIFSVTALAEVVQMGVILLIARPFGAASKLVSVIALPMIVMNALGMVIFIQVFNHIFKEEDSLFGEKMRVALTIAEKSLPHLRKGLHSISDMQKTTDLIFHSHPCSAVIISDMQRILAMTSGEKYAILKDKLLLSPILAAVCDRKTATLSYERQTDSLYPILKNHVMIAAPLIKMEQSIGSLIIIVKRSWRMSDSNLVFTSELARIFSTQLELSDLDYQKELLRKAELKALWSQVNPHFLYNALNTIAFVCRENSDRARELLLTLSSYYRQTLENDTYMISLSDEISHVAGYLQLEQARFEEKLVVEFAVDDTLSCMVPSFILQPLVENAVRYGIDREGNRYVKISAVIREGKAAITIQDKGPGIPEEIIESIHSGRGKRVGLLNVQQRLKSIYGDAGALQIVSSEEGTSIGFCIPLMPADPMLLRGKSDVAEAETKESK